MTPRHPWLLASLLCPSLPLHGQVKSQKYETSYQYYQEDDDRIRVESYYLRGAVEVTDSTSFRFQWLSDSISGATPTGAMPGGTQPYLADLEDVRTGILGAISQQFGDHRVELEISHSSENDYLSRGYALSDTLQLNQKNTTVTYGVNYLDDEVSVPGLGDQGKASYDLFTGVSQLIDKNTVVTANLTLGYSKGYLNDPYKIIQRTDTTEVPNGLGGTTNVDVVNTYRENRPDHRFRQVLQLEGKHYVEAADGVVDAVLRLSHDDYGILSETVQLEWRQNVGKHFQAIPFFRYYHQNAASFFSKTLDGVPVATPSTDPQGDGTHYSADYRLSSFNAVSGGVRLRYSFSDSLALSAAYERYVMTGTGGEADQSQSQAYISADIWTFGLTATF